MKKRNSRWDDEPRLDDNGQPIVVYPCDSDRQIFQLLNRYRYLPINFIAAFTGLSMSYLHDRLDLLARQPNKFLNRPEKARSQPNANYRFLDYELAEKGETNLKDNNMYSSEPRFGDKKFHPHSRMINEGIINIEMGARLQGNEMIWYPEIAARMPVSHRYLPVHIEHPGKASLDFDYTNDSNGPFGVRYHVNKKARFYSLEAEHMNQVDCSNLKKTSFLKKYLAIKYLMDNDLYETKWGLPNLFHLFLVPYQARIDTMKELIMRETNGKGCSYMAFAIVPVIEDPKATFLPDLELFTRPWQRAGQPDFYLNQPTAKKAAA